MLNIELLKNIYNSIKSGPLGYCNKNILEYTGGYRCSNPEFADNGDILGHFLLLTKQRDMCYFYSKMLFEEATLLLPYQAEHLVMGKWHLNGSPNKGDVLWYLQNLIQIGMYPICENVLQRITLSKQDERHIHRNINLLPT